MTDFISRYYASADPATLAARFLMGVVESGLRYGYQVRVSEQKWNWQRTAVSLAAAEVDA